MSLILIGMVIAFFLFGKGRGVIGDVISGIGLILLIILGISCISIKTAVIGVGFFAIDIALIILLERCYVKERYKKEVEDKEKISYRDFYSENSWGCGTKILAILAPIVIWIIAEIIG